MPNKAAKNRRRNIKQGITLKMRCSFLNIPTTRKGPDGKPVKETRNALRKALAQITGSESWPVYLAKAGKTEAFFEFQEKWRKGTLPKAA